MEKQTKNLFFFYIFSFRWLKQFFEDSENTFSVFQRWQVFIFQTIWCLALWQTGAVLKVAVTFLNSATLPLTKLWNENVSTTTYCKSFKFGCNADTFIDRVFNPTSLSLHQLQLVDTSEILIWILTAALGITVWKGLKGFSSVTKYLFFSWKNVNVCYQRLKDFKDG